MPQATADFFKNIFSNRIAVAYMLSDMRTAIDISVVCSRMPLYEASCIVFTARVHFRPPFNQNIVLKIRQY